MRTCSRCGSQMPPFVARVRLSDDAWGCVRCRSSERTASLEKVAALPNPAAQNKAKDEWYHGSPHAFEELDTNPGRYQDYDEEYEQGRFKHWNTLIGPHFGSEHFVARNFAEGGHGFTGHGDEDEYDEHQYEGPMQHVVHVKLHIKNPKVYKSEYDMDHEVHAHELAQGNTFQKHFPKPDEDDDPEYHDEYEEAEHKFGKEYLEADKPFNPREMDERGRPKSTKWLSRHPDKEGIARRYRERMEKEGHDGVVYGNEYEGGGNAAIAFHPHQVEETQHHYGPVCLSDKEAQERKQIPGQGHLEGMEDMSHRRRPVDPKFMDPYAGWTKTNHPGWDPDWHKDRKPIPGQRPLMPPLASTAMLGDASDWDTYYSPDMQVHRGIHVKAPMALLNKLHDPEKTAEVAQELVNRTSQRKSTGMHWSSNLEKARDFGGQFKMGSDVPVILHGQAPAREDIETRPAVLKRNQVFDYHPTKGEQEVPLRKGAGVDVFGISWKPHETHPHADEHGWVRHDFTAPVRHTAGYTMKYTTYGPEGYVDKEREVEGPLYHGSRAKNLKPGDLVRPGRKPNAWGDEGPKSKHVFFTTRHDTARSYADQAGGHVYEVEPTGEFHTDYNGDDYKTKHPLRVIRRVESEQHTAAQQPKVAYFGETDWDEHHSRLPDEVHRGLFAPQSHDVLAYPASDEDIAHGLISAHQEEQFAHHPRQNKVFGTHWTSEEGVARKFALEHQRAHAEDHPLEDGHDCDEHSEAAPVVFHAQRPERHEIETDPRRLDWQNIDSHDDEEREVPIRHGAPVRITGVSWLKHTGMGPFWHRHDLREPVTLRAEDRDSPDDPDAWNGGSKTAATDDERLGVRTAAQQPFGEQSALNEMGQQDVYAVRSGNTMINLCQHHRDVHVGNSRAADSLGAGLGIGARERSAESLGGARKGSCAACGKDTAYQLKLLTPRSMQDRYREERQPTRRRQPYVPTKTQPLEPLRQSENSIGSYFAAKDGHYCSVCKTEHDDPWEPEEHEAQHTDWDKHYPTFSEIHRGVSVRLPQELHDRLHAEDEDLEEEGDGRGMVMHDLIGHLNTKPGGWHWTADHGVAQDFSHRLQGLAHNDHDTPVTHLVITGNKPDCKDIETDPNKLAEDEHEGVSAFDESPGEKEVPLKRGTKVHVKSVDWKLADGTHHSKGWRGYNIADDDDLAGGPRHVTASWDDDDDYDDDDDEQPEECEECYETHTPSEGHRECNACGERHEDYEQKIEHEGSWTNWDQNYPRLNKTIHRTLEPMKLPSEIHDTVHDESRPASERAATLLGHIERKHGDNIGMHWSDVRGDGVGADKFAGNGAPEGHTQVMLHAKLPEKHHIETDPDELNSNQVISYGDHDEMEVPISYGSPVHVTGVSWRPGGHGQQWRSHNLKEPIKMTASKKLPTLRTLAHDATENQAIRHCPFCGGGKVIGRGDGTVECEFCGSYFTVQVQPQFPSYPQTIGGEPQDVPGMPGDVETPGGSSEPGGFPGGDEEEEGGNPFAEDAEEDPEAAEEPEGEEEPPPFAKKSGLAFRTASGAVLGEDDYMRHLAIRLAPDRDAMIAHIREERRGITQ